MPFQCVFHLYLIAVIRSNKVTADQDQDQDDICLRKIVVDLTFELLTRNDAAIVPCCDLPGSLQRGEMLLKFIA